ncbi:M15 family metallopeptidase [Kocuria sp. JC486]|uniref:D-alanyl-D-alanine carboxypeptidase family protein n=1 Tax=Kocuria soli TaxID=2485125 RepID=A0A3N3ZSD8_9MICC|nr:MULTISPECIES: M15 family metallopeptidase [Kocuria]NHU84789.1 M15 family metallopeptidase [Kocuria sp. JC486]ROZ63520.1 D-alanyl-D-alanine carboxypeptidase family protein [Kocuria soli]
MRADTFRVVSTAALAGLLLVGCGTGTSSESSAPTDAASTTTSAGAPASSAPSGAAAADADTTTADSLDVVVNKQNPLDPADYTPDPLVAIEGQQLRGDAAEALETMLEDMRAEDITVSVTSAYRSYDTQVSTYDHWVQQNGQVTADRISARPGYSEHQTGLAVDLADGSGCDLQVCFSKTRAAQWAADNAFEYGFVLRFPEGKESITGYAYEPWHFRYIGRDQAEQFHASGAKTLEEFYGTGAAADYIS